MNQRHILVKIPVQQALAMTLTLAKFHVDLLKLREVMVILVSKSVGKMLKCGTFWPPFTLYLKYHQKRVKF